jgi:hypothetical protein
MRLAVLNGCLVVFSGHEVYPEYEYRVSVYGSLVTDF